MIEWERDHIPQLMFNFVYINIFLNFFVNICSCFVVLAAVDGDLLLTAMHWRVFRVS